MNILFFSELFYPNGSGAELATYLYARLLSESGCKVLVITNRFAGEEENTRTKNMTIRRLPLFADSRNAKFSIIKRPDVLFSSFAKNAVKWADIVYVPRWWYSAIFLAKLHGKPTITHLHDYVPICPLSNLQNAFTNGPCRRQNALICSPKCVFLFEKKHNRNSISTMASVIFNAALGPSVGRIANYSDAIICVSKAQEDLVLKHEPSLATKTHVIYNPFSPLQFTEVEGEDFGYFGGPSYEKGFNFLFTASSHLKNKTFKVHATKFSKEQQSIFGLASRQFIFYDRLNNDQFETVWRQIRAIVVPSVWEEPLPYVVGEAVLRGRLVIGSNIGGIPEEIEGTEGNVLCEPRNWSQITEALDFVSNLSIEKINELTLKNRKIFLSKFNNEICLERFLKLCRKLV